MNLRKRLLCVVTVVAIVMTFVIAPFGVSAQTGVVVDIVGSTDAGDTFEGTFEIDRFIRQGNQIFARGTLTGTLTDALGNVIGTVSEVVNIPLTFGNSTCEILDLTLGPVDLDLLGLVVHLDQVTLTIDAEQGPGNLLGNLLCAVAGLLDRGGPLQGLTQLLNQILNILG